MDKIKILSAVILFLFLAAFTDILIYPERSQEMPVTSVQFHKIGFGEYVIVDSNKEFTSPKVLPKPYKTNLEPGTYYWKSSGISSVRDFTILSEVAINAKFNGNTTTVENAGNVDVDLEIIDNNLITGAAALGVGERLDLQIKNKIILAKQKDE